MAKGLIQNIAEVLKSYPTSILLTENSDRFLYRSDVVRSLSTWGVQLIHGSNVQQRIQYELRDEDATILLICQNKDTYLEDIKRKSISIDFYLDYYLRGYHIPSIIDLEIKVLDKLFEDKPLVKLDRKETLVKIDIVTAKLTQPDTSTFNINDFVQSIDEQLNQDIISWSVICRIISNGIVKVIGTSHFDEVLAHVNRANAIFQDTLEAYYQQVKNSSAVKKPKIVSKILEYLDFNFQKEKTALIVVDGLAFWQYEILKDRLPLDKNEEVIYSWLPSITQLSRQAIFRGAAPLADYQQGPTNEEKLWKKYWKDKGLNDFEIRYNHETIDLSNLDTILKFAIVFKDLDEKMHSSTDYKDLLKLTENWIDRSNILTIIQKLQTSGFNIFLTTDHGNIQAKGWRGLRGREKLGTNKSGSRSERHIEYAEQWLSDEFVTNNPELAEVLVMEDRAIYFKSDLSFSRKDTLVTHGGAHILEVLIPFIEIKNGK